MDIWTIPSPFVFTLMLGVLYLGLLSMKVQRIAFDLTEELSGVEGSGVSKRNAAGFCSRLTPTWIKVSGWLSSLSALLILVYVGFRFGWPWALAYAVLDHLIKHLEPPILPSADQSFAMLEKQAQKTMPERLPRIKALRPERQSQ